MKSKNRNGRAGDRGATTETAARVAAYGDEGLAAATSLCVVLVGSSAGCAGRCPAVHTLWPLRTQKPVQTTLELLKIGRHGLVPVCFARLALAPDPIVLADAAPSALLARAPYPSVLADARPSALLALALSPIVLADAAPSALSALSPSPIVLTNAPPSALSA